MARFLMIAKLESNSHETLLFQVGSAKAKWLSRPIMVKHFQSKKDSKYQESIQLSTTPVPDYQMGK